MNFERIDVRPFESRLGAQILGVDLSTDIPDAVFAEIERAYVTHSVLVFKGQTLGPGEQVRFTRRFGELEHHVFSHWSLADQPEVLIVSNVQKNGEPIGVYNAGRYWHTDLSYMSAPSRGSLLYAIEVPHDGTRALGDTYFASSGAAFDSLGDDTKAQVRHLRATFSLAHQRQKLMDEGDQGAKLTQEQLAATPVASHSIVQRHPVTGRELLYINEGHTIEILDLPGDEGVALLSQLCAHITQPQHVYQHQWEVGDAVMWDNVATQHLATFDYAHPQRRYMHRTTIKGCELR
jgi:taurine dioxygenase